MSKKVPELKTGNVVYFKEVKVSTKRDSIGVKFRGHGFGVLLGGLPLFGGGDVRQVDITRILGSIGYVSLDNIQEALGDEMAQQALAHFEKKYAYTEDEIKQIEGKIKKQQEGPKPELFNAQGNPMNSPEVPKIVSLKGETLEELKAEQQGPDDVTPA